MIHLETQIRPVEYAEDLYKIVESVFRTMMKTSVQLQSNTSSLSWDFTSMIHYAGSWSGMVTLKCNRSLAMTLAEKFLRNSVGKVSTEEVEDTLGELINMIGGNLKAVLPVGVGISVPVVVRNGEQPYYSRAHEEFCQLFKAEGDCFRVCFRYFP